MKKLAIAVPMLAATMLFAGQASAHSDVAFCATDADKVKIADYYTNKKPGKPMAAAARTLGLMEGTVASGLPAGFAIGVVGTPDNFRKVWSSIESWGARTSVGLYMAHNKVHTYAFPSLVPMTQPDDGGNLQDIYADDGKGIHAHVDRTDVKAIYAASLPGANGVTRLVSFYDAEGDLILGVIASEATGKGEQAAIDGFANTWKTVDAMPRICAGH